MVIELMVEAVTRRCRPDILLLGQDLPQPLGVASLAGQPTCHADNGNGHRHVTIVWSRSVAWSVRYRSYHIVAAIKPGMISIHVGVGGTMADVSELVQYA
jgi:hypothetical protein